MSFMKKNVEKYCRIGQVTDDNMANGHFMLDNWGYKHTITICNAYCFSTATKIARTHHNCLPRYAMLWLT